MSIREHAPEVRSISGFKVPEIRLETSAAGTSYYFEETPGIGAASVFWLIPVSKQSQTKAYQALAAVEMLLSGGDGKSEREILQFIEHLGASVGNDSEQLYARIHFRCAKNAVEPVFNWLLHHVERAEYPKEELERYALVKKASIERRMQTPGYWADRKSKEILYKDIPWVGTFGNLDDFNALSSLDLQSFHQEHIKNSAGILFFSGDIDSQQKDRLISVWESYKRPRFTWELPEEGMLPAFFEDTQSHPVKNTSQVSLKMLKHIGYLEEHQTHQYTLLNMILGGYFGSRLMQELREKQGLTYGISSYFSPLWKGRSWNISGEMNSANTQKALDAIFLIMKELQQNPIGEDELDRAKRYYAGMFRSGFDGPFAGATKALQTLVRNYSATYYAETLEHIWSVNSDSLLQLAQNELNTNTFVKVVSGDV